MYSIECNDVHLVFFLSLSASRINIHNDMYIYIYMLYSIFIESLLPKPVLQPLNKKKHNIPCQDLKKKQSPLVGWGIQSICFDGFETEQSSTPEGSIPTTCRVVEAPQIQLQIRWSHRSHHLWVIPEQHRCRTAALHKRVAPCWGHQGGFT